MDSSYASALTLKLSGRQEKGKFLNLGLCAYASLYVVPISFTRTAFAFVSVGFTSYAGSGNHDLRLLCKLTYA